MHFTQLETPRLFIKLLDPIYKPDILNSNKGNVKDYFLDFESIREVEDWINENIKLIKEGKKLENVVIDKDNKAFVGMVAIDNLDTNEPEIRLWIKSDKQGQGYATEAVKALMDCKRG